VTASTHDLLIGDHEVVKTFRSWERDEPAREWKALTLLHEQAPGLAPEPIARRENDGRPAVAMRRLPGVALGSEALSGEQVAAVADAMTRLHTAVPRTGLTALQPRLLAVGDAVRDLREAYGRKPAAATGDAGVDIALAEARRWLGCDEAGSLADPSGYEVFAQADGNLANYLWDGECCRLVDFEDSGVSDRAFEVADLVEHVSVTLTGALDGDGLVELLDLDEALARRVLRMRRLFATFWLHMLLPGNRGHHRNPPGSVERQAERTLVLLA
jgi:hypothetical protein